MEYPAGTPDFVIAAVETLEQTAASMMKRQAQAGSSTGMASAAGYYLAVTDLKEGLDTQAKLDRGDREQKAREAVDRHQREVSGEPS